MDRFDAKQLYAKASTGKIKMWTGWVTKNPDGSATMWTRHGYKDGNLVETPKMYAEGKNIGKANETTPFDQAVAELVSKQRQKMEMKGYVTNVDDIMVGKFTDNLRKPMLAHTYSKRKHNIKWPCFVQPKLNGVRCLITRMDQDTVAYKSRNGKDYTTVSHLSLPVKNILEIGQTLDGEIYHPDLSFQEIVRRVKKQRHDSNILQFWAFDIVDPRRPQLQRHEALSKMFEDYDCVFEDAVFEDTIVRVPTEMAYSEAEMKEHFSRFMEAGFEGIILRNLEGMYDCGNRSKDLQKYKEFIDEEFEVIGYDKEIVTKTVNGNLKSIPLAVWTCKTPEGKAFNVRPKGSEEKRARLYNEAANLIGKNLTVRYQEKSEDGVPIFPVGISIRDYE